MRLIVTRPLREAQQWVFDLSAQGFEAVALPLISIAPADNAAALSQAWQTLDDYVAVMFVSANAVAYFFELNSPLAQSGRAGAAIKIRAWATGPGTTRALLKAGVALAMLDAPSLEAAQFDSEALWARVSTQVVPGARVLIVRGQDGTAAGRTGPALALASAPASGLGRGWLAERIEGAGGLVDQVVAYQRGAPVLSPAAQALAQQAVGDGSVWLLSSSEAVANLVDAMAGQSLARACALATHPRIALAAQEAGFGQVWHTRPTLNDVVAALHRLAHVPQHFKLKP